MFSNDGWARKYDTAATQFLDEPVLAAVQMTRTGGYAAMGASAISGGAAMALLFRGKKKAGGLPQLFIVAVTDERVYALAMRGSFNPRATKVLAEWEREAIEVSTEEVFNGTKLVIRAGDGEQIEVQGPPGELTDRVVRALEPVAVAA